MIRRRSLADDELENLHGVNSGKNDLIKPVISQPAVTHSIAAAKPPVTAPPTPSEKTGPKLALAPAIESTAVASGSDQSQEVIDSKLPPAKKKRNNPGAKKEGKKSQTLTPIEPTAQHESAQSPTSDKNQDYRPWEVHRLSEQEWNALSIYENPINSDEDVIKAELLSPNNIRDYNAIMSHLNQGLWNITWNTMDGGTYRTIELVENDTEVKYRTVDDDVICMRVPQLWMIYPTNPKSELEQIRLITFKQKQMDISALIVQYGIENEKEKLKIDHQTIVRQANLQYQSLLNFLIFREKKIEEWKLLDQQRLSKEQERVRKQAKVISKASPLMALAPSLSKWMEKHGKKDDKK